MVRAILSLVLLAATTGPSLAAIDFTPAVKEFTTEGMTYHRVTLKNGDGAITFILPYNWTVRGGGGRLQLTPPRSNFVEATVDGTPLDRPAPFDEASVKALEEQVVTGTPPGSQKVTVISRQENPVLMNQSLSYELVISYQALGQTFYRSVLFVRTPDTQLVYRFSAPKADFARLNQQFRQSITSWEWVDAKPNPPTRPAAGPASGN